MKLEQKIKSIKNVYHQNSKITSANFPKPKTIRTENYKFIKMPKSYSSQEALDKMKKQGCTPANIWELTEFAEKGLLEKGKYYIAFGQTFTDSDGDRMVPFVYAYSDGGFKFGLGYFGYDWDSNRVLLCLCDLSSDSQNENSLSSLEPLPLTLIINGVKYIKEQ